MLSSVPVTVCGGSSSQQVQDMTVLTMVASSVELSSKVIVELFSKVVTMGREELMMSSQTWVIN